MTMHHVQYLKYVFVPRFACHAKCIFSLFAYQYYVTSNAHMEQLLISTWYENNGAKTSCQSHPTTSQLMCMFVYSNCGAQCQHYVDSKEEIIRGTFIIAIINLYKSIRAYLITQNSYYNF